MLTASQAAEILGVDKRTVLRFVRDGKLRSYRTPGGQHRFRRADVEQLAAGESSPSRLSDSTVQNKREEVQLLNLEVQKRLAKRNLDRIEAEDAAADADARARDQERKETDRQARAARQAEIERQVRDEKHRKAKADWIDYALSLLPADAPAEAKAATVRYMRQVYAELGEDYWDGSADEPDIVELANEAAAKAMAPFERRKKMEKVIEQALSALPWQCRSILRSSPTESERRARQEAENAVAALSRDCPLNEARAAVEEAVRRVGSEYLQRQAEKQHRDQIETLVQWLDGEEQRAVRDALDQLPIGCGYWATQRAKDAALAPIRAAAEAKRKETEAERSKEFQRIQTQVQAQLAKSRAENETDRVLLYVSDYIEECCEDDGFELWERLSLADKIKRELRPKFIQLLLRGELDEDSARELIQESVDAEL